MASASVGTLGASLAFGFLASLLLAAGLMMMKARAEALPIARGRRALGAVIAWIRDPVWLGGLIAQAAGYALYVMALTGAPVSLMAVAMQGGIAMFVVFAVIFLGERARAWEWAGIGAFVAAALILAGSLGAGAAQAPPDVGALALTTAAAAALALGLLARARFRQSGAASALVSGFAFGLGSLYTKALADGLAHRAGLASLAGGLAASPYTYLIIVANVAGLVMLQNAFAMGRGIIAMPLSSTISNLVPIAGGIAVFGERLPADPVAAAMRVAAFALTIAASAALTAGDLGASAR